MKYMIVFLIVTHKIDFQVMKDLSFNTYQECLSFQMFMNQRQLPDSNIVLWCVKKK